MFSRDRYYFTTGLRAGEPAAIRDDSNTPVLGYRSFASIVPVVAALVSGIVFVAGLAAVAFLLAEKAPFRAAIALVLTLLFSIGIGMLVPRIRATIYDGTNPSLMIEQLSRNTFALTTPDGRRVATLRKAFLGRLGRNRWTVLGEDGRVVTYAVEESFGRALLAKFLGKFSRRYEADVRLGFDGEMGLIRRRPDENGRVDVLELTGDTLDRRIAVALATLILGSEP
ncbi:MAG TPA: hypothetical protein VF618_27540 [Thermoanaerobaculia bacterium]